MACKNKQWKLYYMQNYIFWDITLYVPLKINRRFGGTCGFHIQCRRNRPSFSETSVEFQWYTMHYIPGERNLFFLSWQFSFVLMLRLVLQGSTRVYLRRNTFRCWLRVFWAQMEKITYFIIFYYSSEVRPSPLCPAATTGLLYQPQMIGEGDCGVIGGTKIGRGNLSTQRKPAPVTLCPL
jgi:hypothetical protein